MILVSAVHTKVTYTDEAACFVLTPKNWKTHSLCHAQESNLGYRIWGPATNSYFNVFLDCTQHQNEVMTS